MAKSNTVSPLAEKSFRIPSIDRFRGLVIFCMIFFQFAEHFKNLGVFANIAKHSANEAAVYMLPNLALADIVAPMFIFAIGLTYIPSLRRREEQLGKKAAVIHFLQRYLTLIGIGFCLDGINDILDGKSGVVAVIAMACAGAVLVFGLFALIFKLAKKKKVLKVVYTVLGVVCVFAGVAAVVTAFVNFVLLCSGKTDESFGHWVVLQHIGFAGLVTLPFALIKGKKGSVVRITAAVVMLILFGIFHEGDLAGDLFANNRELIDKVADGGFSGGFAWGAMLLIYTFFSEIYYKSAKRYYAATALAVIPVAAMLIGIFATLPEGTASWAGALSSFLPINKGSVSPSYVLICTVLSLIAFAIFNLFNFYKSKFDPLMWWGRNPILMYILEFVVSGGLAAIFSDYFESAGVAVSVIIIAAVVTALTLIAYILNKKKIIVKL